MLGCGWEGFPGLGGCCFSEERVAGLPQPDFFIGGFAGVNVRWHGDFCSGRWRNRFDGVLMILDRAVENLSKGDARWVQAWRCLIEGGA